MTKKKAPGRTPFVVHKVRPLGRRTVLRGAATTAVALPWLEIMSPRSARAAIADPYRYVVSVAGIAHMGYAVPGGAGPLTTLPSAYEPLDALKSKMSLVYNLDIPQGPDRNRANLPPGGTVSSPGHYSAWAANVTGTRGTGSSDASGPSSDYLVAQQNGNDTRFRVLHYCGQPSAYVGGVGACSAGPNGRSVKPVVSPRAAYNELFSGVPVAPPPPNPNPNPGTPPPMPGDGLDEGRSVLDVVHRRAERLRSILGRWDRQRVEQHFDEIRDLERRIATVPGVTAGGGGAPAPGGGGVAAGTCQQLPDPGADPPTQGGISYSNEDLRNDIFADMLAMAFACDLTRVATFMTTYFSCRMGIKELFNVDSDIHSMTHSPGRKAAQAAGYSSSDIQRGMLQWMVSKFARLMLKLESIPEGDGTVLDTTVGVLLWEYGARSHGPNGYCLPIVGGTNVIRAGQIVDGRGRHPANLCQTAMLAVGVNEDFGEVPGRIDEVLL